MTFFSKKSITSTGYALALLLANSANAHHVMDSQLPKSIFEGLLSGIAHPVIGLDHLLFVISIGLLAALSRKSLPTSLIAFILAGFSGVLFHTLGLALPKVEQVIALSVLLSGLIIFGRIRSQSVLSMFAACAGLFHGFAYGEAIYGAPVEITLSYLFGIGLIQCGIAALTYWASGKLIVRSKVRLKLVSQAIGCAIALFGVYLLA